MNNHSILIAVPTYNEKDNVPLLYNKIKQLNLPVDIAFLDDSSPDGTGAVIDNLAQHDAHVLAVHRPKKLGLGAAHKAAFDLARSKGYKYLITMDADLIHDPIHLPEIIGRKDNASIVIGSRYTQGGSMQGWNKIRLPFTYFWRWLIKTFLGMPYDCTGAYRLYNVTILKPEVYNQATDSFSFCMESLYRLTQHGASVTEVPIKAQSRIHGESKLSWSMIGKSAGLFCNLAYDRFLRQIKVRTTQPLR
jgi:dolichol-phosphate mannosyltransferase